MSYMHSRKRILSTVLAGSLALATVSTVDTAAAEQKVGFTAPVRVSKVDPVTGLDVPVTATKATVETKKASDDASFSSKIENAILATIGTILVVAMAVNIAWQMERIYAQQS